MKYKKVTFATFSFFFELQPSTQCILLVCSVVTTAAFEYLKKNSISRKLIVAAKN